MPFASSGALQPRLMRDQTPNCKLQTPVLKRQTPGVWDLVFGIWSVALCLWRLALECELRLARSPDRRKRHHHVLVDRPGRSDCRHMAPGRAEAVSFTRRLDRERHWVVESGGVCVLIGASSMDLRLRG